MFTVQHHAYCGMRVPLGEYEDLADARLRVAQRLRYCRRYGATFTPQTPARPVEFDTEWEIHEPEDCNMVPDFCGILDITYVPDNDNDDGFDFEAEEDSDD